MDMAASAPPIRGLAGAGLALALELGDAGRVGTFQFGKVGLVGDFFLGALGSGLFDLVVGEGAGGEEDGRHWIGMDCVGEGLEMRISCGEREGGGGGLLG